MMYFSFPSRAQIISKEVFIIKEITREEMNVLLKKGIIKNSRQGVVGKDGWPTGYMTTRNKAYIQDKYVDLAKKLIAR